MNPLSDPSYFIPPLAAAAFSGALCVLIGRRAFQDAANRSFALSLLTIASWSSLVYLMRASSDTNGALFWERLFIPVMLVSSPIFYSFTRAYTQSGGNSIIRFMTWSYVVVVLAVGASGGLVERMELRDYGYAPIFTIYFYPIAFWAYTWIGLGMLNIYRGYRTSRTFEERNRFLFISLGTAFPIVGTFLDIFPFTYATSILGDLVFATITTIAIRKYHLFDISLVVRKGIAYLVLSALVAVPYVAALMLVNQMFRGQAQPIINFLLLIVLALFLQPMWSRVQRGVDRFFFGRRLDRLRTLEEFARHSPSVSRLDQLAGQLVEKISTALRVDSATLLLPARTGDFLLIASCGRPNLAGLQINADSPILRWLDREQRPLEGHHFDHDPLLLALSTADKHTLQGTTPSLLVPLRVRENLRGILVLGTKTKGAFYSQEELRFLSLAANQAAVLLDDARLYQEVTDQLALGRQQLEAFHTTASNLALDMGVNGGEIMYGQGGSRAEMWRLKSVPPVAFNQERPNLTEGGLDVQGGYLPPCSQGLFRRRDERPRGGPSVRATPGHGAQDARVLRAPRVSTATTGSQTEARSI